MGGSSNPLKFELEEALDLHENVLHAEEQAIKARDLDTVEEILLQKDESLRTLFSAKQKADYANLDIADLSPSIDRVLLKQSKNAESFRGLHVQKSPASLRSNTRSNNLSNRLRKTYGN